MKVGPSPEASALVAFIADAFHRHLQRDTGVQSACAGLQRMGLSLLIKLELGASDEPPRVQVQSRSAAVPQWTAADREVLRCLGIAGEPDDVSHTPATQPGRRQSG